jgi:hypothetical protein
MFASYTSQQSRFVVSESSKAIYPIPDAFRGCAKVVRTVCVDAYSGLVGVIMYVSANMRPSVNNEYISAGVDKASSYYGPS